MPAHDTRIELGGAVWMTVGGENLGGAGRIALLAQIAECGSITHAAKALKMSYKAAWDAIDTMNNLAGEPLVERVAGGKGGGGTVLTRRGVQLVENFRLIEREHQRFVAQLNYEAEGIADDFLLLRRMAMKTSARNHFAGQVTRVQRGAVNDEIEIAVAGGHTVVATVTHESAEGLRLAVGAQAFALVKASSIVVVADAQGARFSARNQLAGTVARLVPGAVHTEVVIALAGGGSVAATITNESCAALGLAEGTPAMAIFKASSVIVGAPA
ncbi:molybdenum-dependent transcriptional regulator [Acidovorax sp. SRB_14]|uniref:TOBE domain-containing protein n=1 Tax=unclassified Acidovorax TaxID=2684926 RepID=UPI00145D5098|nr:MULTISPECIES: TOBE domain-containing protein [unclassified Acidovorax]NMM75174.1 molybdenum-dependent transcriptional regulator [Acidovorax sp. SRB_24]NMM79896.1 molybdenum-dependent transcriptional regulator [Acidovorax sp. SRB_14]